MTDETADKLNFKIIKRFERRSLKHYALSWAILLLICTLLGVGAFIYNRAAQIAQVDIIKSQDQSVIESIRQQLEAMKNATRSSRRGMIAIYADFEAGLARTSDLLPVMEDYVANLISYLDLEFEYDMRKADVASDSEEEYKLIAKLNEDKRSVLEDTRTRISASLDLIKKWLDEDKGLVYSSDLYAVETSLSKLDSLIIDAKRKEENAKNKINTDELKDDSENKKEKVALGNNTKSTFDTSTVTLIQTNITRFGTLLVIFFFISILVPIYRYTIQMAAFYNSVADSLILRNENVEEDLVLLINTLMPKIQFGKESSTPITQIMEVIRAVSKSESTKKSN